MIKDTDARKHIKFVQDLKAQGYDIDMLACLIGDAYKKHSINDKLTSFDVFILGLRYSEFYADGTEQGYVLAETKRAQYLRVLHIDATQLSAKCRTICGLQ